MLRMRLARRHEEILMKTRRKTCKLLLGAGRKLCIGRNIRLTYDNMANRKGIAK
jgi:hypothetical protein